METGNGLRTCCSHMGSFFPSLPVRRAVLSQQFLDLTDLATTSTVSLICHFIMTRPTQIFFYNRPWFVGINYCGFVFRTSVTCLKETITVYCYCRVRRVSTGVVMTILDPSTSSQNLYKCYSQWPFVSLFVLERFIK